MASGMQGTDYYDIDSILAECETIGCKFRTAAVDIGYLDENNDSEDLSANAVIQLPLWLAIPLHKEAMIEVQRPIYFSERFADAMLVDPTVVNLQSKCQYWYRVADLFCETLANDDEKSFICDWMRQSLFLRNQEIIDQSGPHKSEFFDQFRNTLTDTEQKLFDARHETLLYLYKWKNNIVRQKGGVSIGTKRKLNQI